MNYVAAQIMSYWLAIGCLVLSFVLYSTSIVFHKDRHKNVASPLVWGGFIFTTAGLAFRWMQTGRGPYIDLVEVIPGDAWAALLLYLLLRKLNSKLDILGVFITPITFLMLGIAVLSDQNVQSVPFTYGTYWLYIHIGFAKLAYGSCLISAAMAGLFLVKNRQGSEQEDSALNRLPSVQALSELNHRFAGLGFIMLGVMMLSGAVWAHKSWGRYWGWDPIETWALISWFIYGIYLHLRFTFKISQEKLAWLSVFAFVVVIFAYFLTPYLYASIHEHLT